MKILFTSIGRRIELIESFRSSANNKGIKLKIYGSDITESAPGLSFCDKRIITYRIKDERYIPQLMEICQKEKIDLLIPTIDTDLLILSEHRDAFREVGTEVLISSPDMIKICRDKRFTADFFIDCGLKSPQPVDDIKKYDSGFPCFIKPKDGSSSINAYRADHMDELETFAKEVPDYIIQPFIEGTEYTIDIMCDLSGNPVYITPRERVAVRSGEVLKTRICNDPLMISEAKKIVEEFKPCGPLTVQLIREKNTGEDHFIEINPRFGGGAPLSIKAGADSPSVLFDWYLSSKILYKADFAENAAHNNMVFSRFDQSVCSEGNDIIEINSISEVLQHTSGLKAVIFDLDDTLYNEKDYVKSGYKAIEEYLIRMLGNSHDYDEKFDLSETSEFMMDCLENRHPAIDCLVERLGRPDLKEKLLDIYRGNIPEISLREEAKAIITELSENNYKIGIITDGRPEGQRNKLKALDLLDSDRIDEIIITDELAGRNGDPMQFRKPNSVAFEIMCRRLRVPYINAAYIGDNMSKDFVAPQRLGMRCIHYNNLEGLYRS